MRVTLCAPPLSAKIHKKVEVPFAVVATPLADVENEETPIRLADFGENAPIR